MDHLRTPADLCAMYMVSGISIVAHIFLLHVAMVAYMQDPCLEFYIVHGRTRRLPWTLPLASPWHEFRLRYHSFMVIGDLGADREWFHILGAWITVIKELLLREELVVRGIFYGSLPCIFPTLNIHPSIIHPHVLLPRDNHHHSLQLSSYLPLYHRLAQGMPLICQRVQVALAGFRWW